MKRRKSIYFVQAGNLYGPNAYLPYSAGCVAAHAWNNPVIRETYGLGRFIFLRTPVAQVLESFEEPYMVAFSNYIWNFEYHKALAKAMKQRWPDCLILFGGHQVLNDSSRQLNEYPFVDFLVHKAGEISFEQLLLALLHGEGFDGVPSLSYRNAEGKLLRTEDAPCGFRGDSPSPYLAGLFDGLFDAYPSLLFSMTIETNRGCPYSCAYCDWGAMRDGLHLMPMERVKAEIDWAARHKIEFILCADANFGLLERDEAIVDYLIESKRRTGYPKKLRACLAKDSDEAVFRLNEKLCAHGLHNGAALSFQSFSPEALKSIGRKNLDTRRFSELVALYNAANVPVYSELILGLPGETLESYAKGIGSLLAMGMHGALEIFTCELLPNAEMSDAAYRERHGIDTIRVRQAQRHSSPENQDAIPEYSDIVRQTNAMPLEDWITANLFSAVVQGFHCLGLLPCLAAYLHWERRLPYERFYFDLMGFAYANPTTLAGELFSFLAQRYRSLSQGEGESLIYYHPRFGEVTWSLGEALFLRAAYESRRFYEELPVFLQRYAMDGEVASQLLRYQRGMVHMPAAAASSQAFQYDFPGYFAEAFAGRQPVLREKQIILSFCETPEHNWADFAREYVWYGRRKGALTEKKYEVAYV